MLSDYTEKMWWHGEGVPAAVVTAQREAKEHLDDLQFYVKIALIPDNSERSVVNAGDIVSAFEKDVLPLFDGDTLRQGERLVCRLDWDLCFFRYAQEIAAIPHAKHDRQSIRFVRALKIGERWEKDLAAYEGLPAAERIPTFDTYLKAERGTLAEPVIRLWKRLEGEERILHGIKVVLTTAVIVILVYAAASWLSGAGPVAMRFNHLRPKVMTAEEITALYGDPAASGDILIADYNASSILKDQYGHEWSDRYLRDGDKTTVWAEGEEDDGVNKRLYFNISGKQHVHYLVIWNGDQSSDDAYKAHNRLKTVTLRLDNATGDYRIHLKDTPEPQYIRIERKNLDRLWIIIDSVYPGSDNTNTTCVSEVEIH